MFASCRYAQPLNCNHAEPPVSNLLQSQANEVLVDAFFLKKIANNLFDLNLLFLVFLGL